MRKIVLQVLVGTLIDALRIGIVLLSVGYAKAALSLRVSFGQRRTRAAGSAGRGHRSRLTTTEGF